MTMMILCSGSSSLGVETSSGRLSLLRHEDREFIPQPTGEGPLRLHVPLADYEAHVVSSHRTAPACTQSSDRITMEYTDLLGKRGPTGIGARIVIRAVDDAFELSCTIRNGGASDIPQVFFPYIGGFRPVEGPDDTVVFGKSRFTPWRTWVPIPGNRRTGFGNFMQYSRRPEHVVPVNWCYSAGMKWMDFGGGSGGVSLYSQEKTASAQFMYVGAESFYRAPETIDLGWFFYPFIRPGETWQSATFVLYPHAGNWQRGVLKFKTHTDRTFVPPPSTPQRDATIGQQSLWISWHYQDWQDLRYTFKDIPAIAEEARAAGLREMTLARATELDFCLPHKIRKPLGTSAELKAAVAAARAGGVNITPFITCHLIREDTIGADRNPREWYGENRAGQRLGDNWTYDPHMTPSMPIFQIGSRGGYYACPGSQEWRKAFFQLVDQVSEEWGYTGFMFDQSLECAALCFNPLHAHKPADRTQLLNEVLAEAKRRLVARFGAEAVLSGEGQWDAATEWMDITWDWSDFDADELMAPFHMAFPRARQSMKCTDYLPQINRIFTAGYWLDLNLEDGQGRLGDYPELTRYLASLADFKARFSRFFNQRDVYLYTLGTRSLGDKPLWLRGHRSGVEALVMAASPEGEAQTVDVELNVSELIGADTEATVAVWARTLEQPATHVASGSDRVRLSVPANDFMALHVRPVAAAKERGRG